MVLGIHIVRFIKSIDKVLKCFSLNSINQSNNRGKISYNTKLGSFKAITTNVTVQYGVVIPLDFCKRPTGDVIELEATEWGRTTANIVNIDRETINFMARLEGCREELENDKLNR